MAEKQAADFVLDWAALIAPVPEADIEWVQKAAGQKFAYMTAQFLRRRLDSVAQGRWSYDCEHVPFVQGQPLAGDGEPFVVKGTLTIGGDAWQSVSRSSFGSGKNFKEAETDAFKRAAQRLGIGNELYEMDALPAAETRTKPTLVTSRGPVDTVPKAVPANDGLDPSCPVCNGRMWDNRGTKRNPKAPDFKCRDRGCDGVVWKASSLLETEATKGSIEREMADEDEKLPF